MKKIIGALVAVSLTSACAKKDTTPIQEPEDTAFNYDHPFQNPVLSMEERLDNLSSLLTIDEKIAQLSYKAPSIDRLDIPAYNWWNEALHGVARAGRAG